MELTIKEYLNINAPKYAKFKGYDDDFIKAVNDFTEGAEPTEQVLLFYDEAMDTVRKFLEGGLLIEKFLYGGNAGVSASNKDKDLRATWRSEVFAKLQQELYNKLKLGLEGKEGGITREQFNDYQSKHAAIYNEAKKGDFYTTAYKPSDGNAVGDLQKYYQSHGFNDLAIQPNWESRYHINSSNPLSLDKAKTWNADNLFSAITDDRRFGRDGDWEPDLLEAFLNQLKDLGYTYTLDPKDNYYKLGLLNPNKSQNDPKKPGTPDIQTKGDLESGFPTIENKNPLDLSGKISEMFPHLFELGKFFDALRTNKRMRDLFQRDYSYATEEYRPKHLNIYGDLAALNQGYNEGAQVQLKANRLGANTSDYRTGIAINLQGEQLSKSIFANARKAFNDLARSTAEKATQLEFDNIDKEQAVANENFGRDVAARNVRLNNKLEYMNQQHVNRTNFFNHLATTIAQKNQDRKQFMASMLLQQLDDAINANPELLKALEAYRKSNKEDDFNRIIDIKRRLTRELTPRYYQQLARIRGIKYNPKTDNPFIISAKSGAKVSDDGPVRKRAKDLERHRKERSDVRRHNDKKLDRLGRLTYLWAKRAQGK